MAAQHESTDLIRMITQDHRDVERVFAELERSDQSPDHRRQLADHVIAELVRHSVAEEQFMYPAARKHVPGGEKIVAEELGEHAAAERVMKDLDGLDPADAEFDRLLGKLIADVRHHIEEEERDLLPKLESSCSPEQLRDLGKRVARAKQAAPTRPHPSAPDTPPANLLLDPGAGIIDKVRDALSGRTT